MLERFQRLAAAHATWSQLTFGSDSERGPTGPLNHLAKEVQEAMAAPTDMMEYADLLLLVLDASRRAGITADHLLDVAEEKLRINIAREWGPRQANGVFEHK